MFTKNFSLIIILPKNVFLKVHKTTGDIFFTDPVFGKMTLNANILRGNMHEMPELDNPGFSGVYRVNSKTGEVSIVETEIFKTF